MKTGSLVLLLAALLAATAWPHASATGAAEPPSGGAGCQVRDGETSPAAPWTSILPPGHPPVSSRALPPGHPPITPRLPPGHPPVPSGPPRAAPLVAGPALLTI